jgi:hypothetical protein
MKRILIVVFAIPIILICMGIASKPFDSKVSLNSGYKVQETPTATPTPTPTPSPPPSATPTPVPEPEPVPTPTVTPSNYRSF